ncbi:MAG: EAL domain-containing protein [Nitrospirota bacterium]
MIIAINTSLSNKLHNELRQNGIFITKLLAEMSSNYVLTEKWIPLQLMINDYMSGDKDIKYIFISDENGKVLAHTFKQGFPADLKEANIPNIGEEYSIQHFKTEMGLIHEVAAPVMKGEIGVVHIGISEDKIQRSVSDINKMLLWIMLSVMVIGGIIVVVFSMRLTQPLSVLADAAKAFGSGNLEGKVNVTTRDEIGQLGDTFNQMVEDLKNTTVSQKTLQTILDSMPFGVAIIDKDKRTQSLNKAALTLTGYESEEEIVGMNCNKTFCPAEEGKCPIFDLYQEIDNSEKILVTKEGRRIPILKTVVPIELHNKEVLLEAFIDITERKQAEESLVSAKARLQHLLISSPAVIYSCKSDFNMIFTFVSDNIKNLLGYEPKEFIKASNFWINNIHIDNLDQITAGMKRLLSRGHHIHEYRFRHKDGAYLWLRDEMRLIYDDEGNPIEIVGYWLDITERKQAEEQLSHRAFYDPLTDLPNRALFIDRLQVLIEQKKRYSQYLYAVLFIDIDRFKIINDSLGHLVGDQLLILAAQRLKKSVRAVDTVSRLGGDEFAILLKDLKEKTDIYVVINRIQNEMNLPFNLSGREIFSTISIGIAIADTIQYSNPEEILRDADTAMYYAKDRGKACYVLFEPEMHTHAVKVLQIETDLRRAIEQKEFVLNYQPIVSMKDNNIVGFEALVRWQHPERGLIPPDDFIPIAEETGLIIPIGKWILYEACRQMRDWQEKYPDYKHLSVSVNISSKEFSQPNFVQLIEKVLQETCLNPTSLKLEIVESMIIENYGHASTIFQQLRKLNIQIQIDDFGTGQSALNYMLHLPIDALKIDRSFVRKAAINEDGKEVVKTIIALAHIMKMDVVAEGIETVSEASLFKDMDTEYAQGFFFSKPLDSETIEDKFLSM